MPNCQRETEVYSRVCGFYRPVKNWNPGKQSEFDARKTYDIGEKHETPKRPEAAPTAVSGAGPVAALAPAAV